MADVQVVELSDGLTHVALRGKLDTAGVGGVDLKLTSHLVTRRKPAIIDLREVPLITSLGIGMLVAIARAMRGHGLPSAAAADPPGFFPTRNRAG